MLVSRVADYRDGQDALDSFRRSQTRGSQKRNPNETIISASKETLDMNAGFISRVIAWQEGDISHSQKKCPNSIVNLIRRHKKDSKDTQLARLWPKDKTVYGERDGDCIFVDEVTDRDVPVARYTYKDTKQFFVAWLTAQDTSLPSAPVVCKFRVYKSPPPLERDGRNWMPMRWLT